MDDDRQGLEGMWSKGEGGNKSRGRDNDKRQVVDDEGANGARKEGQEDGEIVGDGFVVSVEADRVVTAGGEGDSKAPFERRRDGVVGGQGARIKPLRPNRVARLQPGQALQVGNSKANLPARETSKCLETLAFQK